jgi:DNA-binding IclR family transcriptional regulator
MVAALQRVLVLEKAWEIISLFTLAEPELDIHQIRDRTGLPSTTCTRLVGNLVAVGVLSGHGERYRIGLAAAALGEIALAGLDWLDVIRPSLARLRDETGETAGYFVRERGQRVCVAFAESDQAIGRRLSLGHTLPLNVGSPGKVILAFDPDARAALDSPLPSYTARTISTSEGLERELARIRRDGWAVSRGEWSVEVGGIAAPVFGRDGRIGGALALSAPISRLGRKRVDSLREEVLACATTLSDNLGARHEG